MDERRERVVVKDGGLIRTEGKEKMGLQRAENGRKE
jgi:hypothetical protein